MESGVEFHHKVYAKMENDITILYRYKSKSNIKGNLYNRKWRLRLIWHSFIKYSMWGEI